MRGVGLNPDLPRTTERLLLRVHRRDDLEDLVRFHGDPEVVRFIPWPQRDRAATGHQPPQVVGQLALEEVRRIAARHAQPSRGSPEMAGVVIFG